MTDVTLLFGIGATKAGTSWLQYYLDRHPEVHLWTHKELHYFDALDRDQVMEQIDGLCEKRTALRARMRQAEGAQADRLRFEVTEIDRYLGLLGQGVDRPQAYVAFLKKGRKGAKVVGDITPAYALLSEERLRAMAALAPVTKFVYLLRDPIDRLWSNIRMMAGWKGGSEAEVADRANWIFDRWTRGEELALAERCDYAGPLTRILAAIPEADRFLGFYEELFRADTVARLCAFLGIEARPAPLETRVHQSARIEMEPGRRAIAAAALAPQYDHVTRLLGRIPAGWDRAEVGA
jgi:hypothetical protein